MSKSLKGKEPAVIKAARLKSCLICCRDDIKTKEIHSCPSCKNEVCKDCIVSACLAVNRPPTCMFPDCSQTISLKVIYGLGIRRKNVVIEHFKNVLFEQLKVDSMGHIQRIQNELTASANLEMMNLLEKTIELEDIDISKYVLGLPEAAEIRKRISDDSMAYGTDSIIVSFVGGTRVPKETKSDYSIQYIACPYEKCNGTVPLKVEKGKKSSCIVCQKYVCVRCGEKYTASKEPKELEKVLDEIPEEIPEEEISDEEIPEKEMSDDEEEISDKDISDEKDKHVCDKNSVKSMKVIKSSCKPCPKCKMPIYRIAGCSQMFCTMPECTSSGYITGFDYKTGKILKSMHNPHMINYILSLSAEERAARNAHLKISGGTTDINGIEHCGRQIELKTISMFSTKQSSFLKSIIQMLNDTSHSESIRRLATSGTYEDYSSFIDLYLQDIKSADFIKTNLFYKMRKTQRAEAMTEIVNTTKNSIRDLFYLWDEQGYNEISTLEKLEEARIFIDEIKKIIIQILDTANKGLRQAYIEAGFSSSSSVRKFDYMYACNRYVEGYWGNFNSWI